MFRGKQSLLARRRSNVACREVAEGSQNGKTMEDCPGRRTLRDLTQKSHCGMDCRNSGGPVHSLMQQRNQWKEHRQHIHLIINLGLDQCYSP
jgi:hypothetical protein